MVDYCTGWPEQIGQVMLAPCCALHDEAFSIGGGLIAFLSANYRLGECVVLNNGGSGTLIGIAMCVGTTLFGAPFWLRARRKR